MYVSFCHPLQDKKGGEGEWVFRNSHTVYSVYSLFMFLIYPPSKYLDLKKDRTL